ncbi:hypothetical protein [Arsukibacterium indicum]|uniref:DUF4124 domain-containing protein n=1 Tax=Arsukibacterium indicum TaxID=2848612 RepID=A0ABS6MNF0_9GAMM|nr:hypothetical protein [Arsukibacterium indicum]MBV2130334.1 hypothetical protein [Arsukibacterium indicum]
MKMIMVNAALIAFLTGCALPQAQAEQPAPEKAHETRIVVMQDGEKKEWRFSGENWRDSDEWQQFIATLEPEQQHKLEKLLASAPPVPPMPPHPPKVSWQDHDGIQHIVIRKQGEAVEEQQLIEIHRQAGEHAKLMHIEIQREAGEHSFSAIKHLLENAELTKEQLQQLQALLDSKH